MKNYPLKKEVKVRKIEMNSEIDIFISSDIYEEEKARGREMSKIKKVRKISTAEVIIDSTELWLTDIFSPEGGNDFLDYIKLYQKAESIRKKLAILHAHGEAANGYWIFFDGLKIIKINSWLKKYDGQYACLLLLVCNPAGSGINAGLKKSLILFADTEISKSWLWREGISGFRVLKHPREGEIDSYTLEYYKQKIAKGENNG